jgi:hypothetical protein
MHLRDPETAFGFASAIATAPRLFTGGTSLGGAIHFSLDLLEGNGFAGRHRVIDVSGDGYGGLSPKRERDRALARGVTINGLAILDEKPELAAYYAAHVVGGTGSFVVTADSHEDFAEAIRKKLIAELSGLRISALSRAAQP